MNFVAGVDAHKETHTVVFLDQLGRRVQSITIQADASGYQQAMSVAQELPGSVLWGLESTGCYANAFARRLLAAEAEVYEVPGLFTKRHRQQSSRKGKSDPLDAQAIAEAVIREGARLPKYMIAVEREALRIRFDQRDKLTVAKKGIHQSGACSGGPFGDRPSCVFAKRKRPPQG